MNENKKKFLKLAEAEIDKNNIQSASKYLAQFAENINEKDLPLEFLNLARKCIAKDIEFLKNNP